MTEDTDMSADNVVRLHPEIEVKTTELDAHAIEDLRKRAILRDVEHTIELEPFGPGDTQVGVLTDFERAVYVERAALWDELQELHKELTARAFEMLASAVRKSDRPDQIGENIDKTMLFPTKEDAEAYFSLETRFQHLTAVYNSSIRERYGHGGLYGVRTGFTVVRTGYKYETPKVD